MRQKAACILLICLAAGIFQVRTYRFNRREQSPMASGLQRVIDEIRFEDVPLESALAELSRRAGVMIEVDWTAVEPLGVGRAAPIRMRLFNLRAAMILDAMLTCARGAKANTFGAEPLCVVSSGEACRITRLSAVPLEVRMYRYDDLIERIAKTNDRPLSARESALFLEAMLPYASNSDRTRVMAWRGRAFVLGDHEYHGRVERILRNLHRIAAMPETRRPIEGPIDLLQEP